ncbi:hypothetical protein [Nostoc sp. JL33]|uniref:hypothetical protein n=1 Tax=Nostoc sp. JL33 TaxID=2815396 RepID=UPI0025E7B5D5|nr:hypothetical protein [Nostoc sp. JL33]
MGGAERNPTDYQDVGLRKASTQPTIFLLVYPVASNNYHSINAIAHKNDKLENLL